nr:uncharacterized protein LOC109989268 [Labrus bergylta]
MSESTTIIQLFVGLLLSVAGGHASCPIELSPPSVVVRYGDPVSINCSTSETLFEGIGWEATEGAKPLQNVSHLTWTVDKLTDWSFSTSCYFNYHENSSSTQCLITPDVVLYTFPEAITMSSNSDEGVMKEMEEYNFTCHIPNIAPVQRLSVKWYKGDDFLHTETFNNNNKKPVNQTSILRFKATRQDSGVTFRCEAHMDLGQGELQLIVSSQDYNITVHYGPELLCPSTYTALEHAPHSLTCTVKGFPEPEVIWYKEGEEVELSENLTKTDAGQYIITASNKLSSVNLSVDITVLYPPSQIVELEDSEVSVGSTVWLKCSSTGNPRPKYSWDYYRTDNVEVDSEDGVSRLIIHNATAFNMGLFTCHTWNDMGNVSKTARVTVKGAEQECPIEITPDRMVIEYQGRNQNATCKAISNMQGNVKEIYWQGNKSSSWSADTHKDWDPKPVCNANFEGIGWCKKRLNFTLYKIPDSVSILIVGNLSSVVEAREFQLQCDITNVAPAGNLAVRWYIGNETIEPLKGSVRVTGCLLENNKNCDGILSPLNVLSTISITLNRTHNGAELRCEAQLDLGFEEPQPPPNMKSSPLNISVHYKPIINTTKLAKTVPVFRGYPEELVCEADGNPPPKIVWLSSSDNVPHVSGNMLTVSEAGLYNCTAANDVDSISFEVEVILKEDYLPLIAGFVAVTVVAISIIFVFIYSIYYKNTKMRRYSLKNPKLNTHNGNVAHNGWDMQFPMTKLPYFSHGRRRRPTRARVYEFHVNEKKERADTYDGHIFVNTFFVWTIFHLTLKGFRLGTYCRMLFFVLIALSACSGQPVTSSCPVEMSPTTAVVRFGDPFSANCSSLSNQTEGMGWESTLGGTPLTHGFTFLPLKIDSVTDWTVNAQCFLNTLDENQCFKILPITVYKTPDSVSVHQVDQKGPIVSGQLYYLQCDVENVAPMRHLSVYWYQGNQLVEKHKVGDPDPIPASKSFTQGMRAHSDDNGTKIWCEAQLNFPGVPNAYTVRSEPHELIVLYPPFFMDPANETHEIRADSKTTLNCTATGNPSPSYSWHFPDNTQMNWSQHKHPAFLTPDNDVPGTYKCTASNTQGTTSKYFTVIKAKGNRTTFAALVGGFVSLGALLFVGGLFFMTPEGTFAFNKGSYLKGQPTSSGPRRKKDFLPFKCSGAWGPFCSNIVPCRVAKFVQVGFFFPSRLYRRISAESNMGTTFLSWILTFCMFYSVSGEGCSLILKPSRVVVGFGEPVSVTCEAARPVRVLGWESAISAAHTQQELSVQWKVDSLIDWIEEPICYGVFFTAPRQCEEKLNLVLYKTPDSVSIRPVNLTGPMVEGKEYQLLCEVQNIAPVQYLTLRWYKGQTEVYNHSFSDLTSTSPVQVSSILLVTPTKAENGAQYRCVAELELGPEGPKPPPTVTSEPLNASVYFPPAFLNPEPEVLDLIEGVEITLNCTATGNPAPVYSWQSSHPIPERMEDEAALTSSSLIPGTYTCTASNTLEKRSKQFIIKAATKGA